MPAFVGRESELSRLKEFTGSMWRASDGMFGLQFESLILKNRAAVGSRLGNGVEDQMLDSRYFDAVIDFGELWQ